jgi:catalase
VTSAVTPLPEGRPQGQRRHADEITRVEPGNGGACASMTFNPTLLPKGVGASADPLLRRAAPYAVSLGRRLQGQWGLDSGGAGGRRCA